jgi:hypothetical protein
MCVCSGRFTTGCKGRRVFFIQSRGAALVIGLAKGKDDAINILDRELPYSKQCGFQFTDDGRPSLDSIIESRHILHAEVESKAILKIQFSMYFAYVLIVRCSKEELHVTVPKTRARYASFSGCTDQFESEDVPVELNGTRHIFDW